MQNEITQVTQAFSVSGQVTRCKLLPSSPRCVINGQKPSRLAWVLKQKILPPVYWKATLKGKEWMADPAQSKSRTHGS